MTNYDFKSARRRIQQLKSLYLAAARSGDEMACWALAAEIDEIEREISEAHKEKIALAGDSFHSNILMFPSLSQ